MQKTSYNTKQDVKYIMMVTRNILLAIGVWPSFDRERSICKRICTFLLIFISCIVLLSCLVPGIICWILEKKLRARIKMTTVLYYACTTCGKYVNLIIRQGQIRCCLQHIEEDWKKFSGANTRSVMLEYARNGRRLIAISAAFYYSSGLSLRTILPLSKGKTINEYNVTIRSLPYPTYLFSLNVYASPAYELLYMLQFICGIVTLSISSGSCGLLIAFVMHACGQLKILMDLMKSFIKEQKESEVDKKLADVVEHQIRIHSFVQLVEHTLQQICLLELAAATGVTCVLGYCIIMEWENSNPIAMCSYFISFSTSIVGLFIFCYIGEQLMTQAEKVATTACELEWYRLPDKRARDLVLIMIMSKMSLKITAGKILDLSVYTFGNILKTTMAYFNMLRNVTE